MFEVYLDVDEPHLLGCILKYAIEVSFGDEWVRWINPMTLRKT